MKMGIYQSRTPLNLLCPHKMRAAASTKRVTLLWETHNLYVFEVNVCGVVFPFHPLFGFCRV